MPPTSDPSRETVIRLLQQGIPRPSRAAADRSAQKTRSSYLSRAPRLDWAGLDTPIGRVHLAAGPDGLQQVDLHREQGKFLASLDPRAQLRRDGPDVRAPVQALQAYFAHGPRDFELALDLDAATEFQQKVLHAIRSIAPGETWSYGRVAEQIGVPGAARAVGQVLGANPIPIVIPCHRVIASDGSLGGYTGGLRIKEFLLQHEGAR